MKKLNKKELKEFINKFQIKCKSVVIYDEYILVDNIKYKKLKKYLSM